MRTLTLRDITTPADWSVYAKFCNVHTLENPSTPEQLAHWASETPERVPRRRCIVELDGAEVGAINVTQAFWSADEGLFSVRLYPSREGDAEALADQFFEIGEKAAKDLGCQRITVWTRTDIPETAHVAEARGYKMGQRNPVTSLDLAAFDPSPWQATIDAALARGYEFKTWAEVAKTDPDYRRKWWEFDMVAMETVPLPYEWKGIPYEDWLKFLEDPSLDETLQLNAFKDGEIVAMTGVFHNQVDTTIFSTGLTATHEAHRRQGLATALKVQNLAEAKRRGGKRLYTDNEEKNPMLGLNVALGFCEEYASVHYDRAI
ncbi:MAG: GNAT family N-acetyltransferase [Fimbriimonadaceae bacterium]|nr:GNAT family N-acetyltransferase [Fimbriimonadaceae bacterium]QYK55883.1 MAG: GNAT family N-acetyltransferase [Fimbriimonadaceae bacterium]